MADTDACVILYIATRDDEIYVTLGPKCWPFTDFSSIPFSTMPTNIGYRPNKRVQSDAAAAAGYRSKNRVLYGGFELKPISVKSRRG